MRGSCNALIVSPPTIDIVAIGDLLVMRPGGPGLYAGFSLKIMGCEVSLLGPIGDETLKTIKMERELGLSRLWLPAPGPGFVFRLEYRDGGRRTLFTGKREVLDPQVVLSAIRILDPDILVISPIYGELSPSDAVVACSAVAHCAVDVQGFVRAGLEAPQRVPILHASNDDMRYEDVKRMRSQIIYYTRGSGPISALIGGKEIDISVPPVRLPDPTGAGDIFTAIAIYLIREGEDPLSAAEIAATMIPRVLEALRSRAASDGSSIRSPAQQR